MHPVKMLQSELPFTAGKLFVAVVQKAHEPLKLPRKFRIKRRFEFDHKIPSFVFSYLTSFPRGASFTPHGIYLLRTRKFFAEQSRVKPSSRYCVYSFPLPRSVTSERSISFVFMPPFPTGMHLPFRI